MSLGLSDCLHGRFRLRSCSGQGLPGIAPPTRALCCLGENFFASLVNVRNLPMHRGEGGGGEGEGGGGEGEGGEGEGGGGDGGSEGDGGGGEGAGGEGATRVSQNLKVWAPRTRNE